jgi:putative hydrolase of the HAD superfamily
MKSKYKAVIFDLFGTLVNIFSREEYEAALKKMVAALGVPFDGFYKIWNETGIKRGTGFYKKLEDNLAYICRELKVPVIKNQLKTAKEIRLEYVRSVLPPRDNSLETLAALKKLGYKIGLVSNCSTEPPILWPETPFAPYFDATVFSATSGFMKPDPKIYGLAIKKLKVKPEDCLYVGDGDNNELTGAASVGMYPVRITTSQGNSTRPVRAENKLDEYPCPYITSLKEVLNLVK